ncbi:D-glycero-beta-D-manno-heptose-1,7-bisphosphate 7-phosphatase [Chromatiales bacterium (ex Bugula neritina AB1)]|nr:D-glycero-beta-D-manno-heptose-1,7-bisphosphate 7-phosphatase [Chromatiales bacterium (ex Bugula neritina AB1)]
MKLVLLDRDGVINEESDGYIRSEAEWLPIEGSIDAIARLCQADYRVVVVTNQSGIARGLVTLEELHAIHERMHQAVAASGGRIDAVFICPHKPDDDCNCRKPRPGMLHSVMQRLDIELAGVPLVGDSLRDVQSAMVVGATPVLVRTGHGSRTLEENRHLENIEVHDDLASFVDELLADSD